MAGARSTAPFRINVTRRYCSVERGLGYKINERGALALWSVAAVRQAVGDVTVSLSEPLFSGERRREVSKQQ